MSRKPMSESHLNSQFLATIYLKWDTQTRVTESAQNYPSLAFLKKQTNNKKKAPYFTYSFSLPLEAVLPTPHPVLTLFLPWLQPLPLFPDASFILPFLICNSQYHHWLLIPQHILEPFKRQYALPSWKTWAISMTLSKHSPASLGKRKMMLALS